MKLALIRHGITEWNLEKRIQGRTDTALSEQGRRRLEKLQLPTVYLDFDWYCSPLKRAQESARALGLRQFHLEPALIEMDWGDWEGEILKPLRRRIGQEMRDNESRGLDFRPPGGESPRQVQQRLRSWLHRLALGGRDSGAVTHKGIIRCIYALASDWDMRGESPLEFDWDALHEFELDADGGLLDRYLALSLDPGNGKGS